MKTFTIGFRDAIDGKVVETDIKATDLRMAINHVLMEYRARVQFIYFWDERGQQADGTRIARGRDSN